MIAWKFLASALQLQLRTFHDCFVCIFNLHASTGLINKIKSFSGGSVLTFSNHYDDHKPVRPIPPRIPGTRGVVL